MTLTRLPDVLLTRVHEYVGTNAMCAVCLYLRAALLGVIVRLDAPRAEQMHWLVRAVTVVGDRMPAKPAPLPTASGI